MASSGRDPGPSKRDLDRVQTDDQLIAFCTKVEGLLEDGLTVALIAERLGVSRDPILTRSRRGRAVLDARNGPASGEALAVFAAEVAALDPFHPGAFGKTLVRALALLHVDDVTFAAACSATAPTPTTVTVQAIRRWKIGQSAPPPLFRKFVYAWIVNETNKRITLSTPTTTATTAKEPA